jgi:replicative DNA helicase
VRFEGVPVRDHDNLRLPPQNLDAERGVLGSVMLLNESLDEIQAIVSADSFYSHAHQQIFCTAVDMRQRRVRVDAVTLSEEMMSKGTYESVGGAAYIMEVLDTVPHSSHALYYARIVREKYLQRCLIYKLGEIQASLFIDMKPDQAVAELDSLCQSIGVGLVGDETITISEAIDKLQLWNRKIEAGEMQLVSTSIPSVDRAHKHGGMLGGWLAIIAARTGIGKTSLLTQMLCHNAENDVPALMYSLETNDYLIASDVLAAREESVARKLPLRINDKAKSIRHIVMDIRNQVRRNGVKVVGIDYVQLIQPTDTRLDRRLQVAEISGCLVALKRELNITIIGLSQVVQSAEDREPKLNDLSETGSLSNDADSVLLLHRPRNRNESKLIVAKIRHGGMVGSHLLTYDPETAMVTPKDEFAELSETM